VVTTDACVSPAVVDAAIAARSSCSIPPAARPNISVLIIDDDIPPNDALVQLLSSDNFDVISAQSGAEGLELAFARCPQVVVLDLHLPDILGITVLSHLRNQGFTNAVIVVTGWYGDTGHEQAARALGASFSRKPIDPTHLAGALRRLASQGNACSRARPAPEISRSHVPARTPGYGSSDDESLRILHERGVAGDHAAVNQVLESLEPVLRRSLTSRFRRVPQDWVHDAVQDALLEYMARCGRYDRTRGVPLRAFMIIAAKRNLLNRIDSEQRRGAYKANPPRPMVLAVRPTIERRIDIRRSLLRVAAFLDRVERSVLRAMLLGECSSEELARTADVEHLIPVERRASVRRIKNRIFQRLRRLGQRS
jgi:CheY-like chemotaxis protein